MKRNYVILVCLALVFACPGIAAFIFYQHPQWLGDNAINKGTLLSPPEYLANLNTKPKWRIMLWNPGDCTKDCLSQLDKLARVRLALGRRLYDVDELLVTDKTAMAIPSELVSHLKKQDIHIVSLETNQQHQQVLLINKPQVFIVNPDNYMILAYAINALPQDIFHDIQQLLRSNQHKSG